ncbi:MULTISPECIES: hypothetical protein [Pseudomonas]|jgi:hypothetical protein|uniref:Uncharacterized protein n=2 Tax=Pseudomonas TaxID=286 RepID=Q8VMQ0_PSEPU|nr:MULTISPECIES: hypothetical protein [Pseudomonas]KAB0494853.1 hypothetical protein F7R06_29140 [Pseudomonas moorei]MDD2039604.1 hypothetical protein [Pseudomonas putida]MDD2082357.1 hypothetical protein [Pseudomonas putida]QDW60899.1 hypothetical protein FFH79_029200 [Pseudomonas sp. KBS0802]QLJ17346.1 hypothetical protein H0H12_28910 [Pseudomonas putida]
MPQPSNRTFEEQELHAKAQCYDWNSDYPKGALVSYEELLGQGETHRAETRGKAWVMCGQAVIFVDGLSGAVSLDHCTVIQALDANRVQVTGEVENVG